MRFVFFSMNDFTRQGGGTIRIQGILNELTDLGHEVVFVSNLKKESSSTLFHPNIQHHDIGFKFTQKDKRIFQALIGLFPVSFVNIFYSSFLKRLQQVASACFGEEPVYFCEYLDNSIGYWLKKNKLISGYINDLHGVATLEFDFQYKAAKGVLEKAKFYAKYRVSDRLDLKVCNASQGLIFASRAMEDFFIKQYPGIASGKNYILPYVLGSGAGEEKVDQELRNTLVEQYAIQDNERIVLFAGAFKKTGGVPDLIDAFAGMPKGNTRLMLVGDGPTMQESRDLVKKLDIEDRVIFVGRTPYHHLRTYQDLADIIVCPDKQNMYSELIIHVKYLDALISGKLVINGSFKSVMEVNQDDRLSVSFVPSDVQNLSAKMTYCLEHFDILKEKYKDNVSYVSEHLTYRSKVWVLEKR